MSCRIEDYALISNMRTAALVGRDGSIDWLCMPRFDSPACCAALVGDRANGRWQIAPQSHTGKMRRAYRGNSMIMETTFETDSGEVALIDFLAIAPDDSDTIEVVRIVEGRAGSVHMHMDMILRFDYGRVEPWSRQTEDGVHITAGPDALQLSTRIVLEQTDDAWHAQFVVRKGERIEFVLTRQDAWREQATPSDAETALSHAERIWHDWSAHYTCKHPWRDAVLRSLLTLKALTDQRTGGIVGAPTLGLPEIPGGSKNYDYRYTWLRDATFTLYAMIQAGYHDEAQKWRDWLLRTTAGSPEHLQPVYTLDGAWRLPQQQLDHLEGFQHSRPVHVGNQAWQQTQVDAYGELINGIETAHRHGLKLHQDDFDEQVRLVEFLEGNWQEPGCGIWELGDQVAEYTHSQVMAWVAADRVARLIESSDFNGDAQRWRALAARIHANVCKKGFDAKRNTFVQRYGASALDAAVLRLPIVGFLPVDDPRMLGTIEAIQKYLCRDGFIWRYSNDKGELPDEGSFLVCSFWMVENLAMLGRKDEARAMFERLLEVRNDVGLLAEEYAPADRQLRGNFPQAFSHVGLINAAHRLADID